MLEQKLAKLRQFLSFHSPVTPFEFAQSFLKDASHIRHPYVMRSMLCAPSAASMRLDTDAHHTFLERSR